MTIAGGIRRLATVVAVALLVGCVAEPPVTIESPPPQGQGGALGDRAAQTTPAPAAQGKPQPQRRADAAPALRRARTPAEVAQILTRAETTVRDPSVRGEALAQAGHLQQRVYRLLVRRPGLRKGVVGQVPEGLRSAVRSNLDAGLALASLVSPQKDLPDWRIVNPAPAPALQRAYRRAAARFGLEWEYLAAINLVETRMGRIRGRSTAGAQGPMQFMPQTWDAYGRGDINDPNDAITAAARYLAASGGPQDMRGALFAYNRSTAYVDAVAAYADVMRADPRAFRGYYHWQVYYSTGRGDVLLSVGYGS